MGGLFGEDCGGNNGGSGGGVCVWGGEVGAKHMLIGPDLK